MKKYSSVLFVLLVLSCSGNDKPQSPIIAKVDNKVYTVDDLRKTIPQDPAFDISELQVHNFVKRWIETELVYQDAIANKFDKNPEIKEDLQKVVRDFLVARYIEEKIDKDLEVTEEEIKEYYNRNNQEFIRPSDYYKIRLMLLKTYIESENVRRRLANGESFATLARENSLDESKENNGELGWVTVEDLPQVIVEKLPYMRENRITPIKSINGYYLVEITEIRKKGDIQTLDEVKDLVTWRIMAYKRENKYRRLVTYLSENAQVETNWDLIHEMIQDSSIQQNR